MYGYTGTLRANNQGMSGQAGKAKETTVDTMEEEAEEDTLSRRQRMKEEGWNRSGCGNS